MPWQMAPPLLIVATAFAVTGLGMQLTDNLFLGRVSKEFITTTIVTTISRTEECASPILNGH